jgi:EAL domain-containing protein (putative c-di-GMP-specific phosphodiesterase class I)
MLQSGNNDFCFAYAQIDGLPAFLSWIVNKFGKTTWFLTGKLPGKMATLQRNSAATRSWYRTMEALPFDLLPLPPGLGISAFPDGTVVGRFLRTDLSSVFQPLIDSTSGACAGHEAFVRVHGQGELNTTPWNLFSLVANDEALVALDRLCRFVHTLNFLQVPDTPGRLFLNVHGRLLAAVREDHGHTFRDALDRFGMDPPRIVIETPESANTERALLALVLSNYRLNGFAVAANTTGLADMESLLRMVRPDFVKIDARQTPTPESMRRVVALARDSGTRPIFMRVESGEQRDFLQTLPDVLLQGWAIARPSVRPGAWTGREACV